MICYGKSEFLRNKLTFLPIILTMFPYLDICLLQSFFVLLVYRFLTFRFLQYCKIAKYKALVFGAILMMFYVFHGKAKYDVITDDLDSLPYGRVS